MDMNTRELRNRALDTVIHPHDTNGDELRHAHDFHTDIPLDDTPAIPIYETTVEETTNGTPYTGKVVAGIVLGATAALIGAAMYKRRE